MIYQAVHAGFAYFQREAGYTRTGSHGKRAGGRETGQWHGAGLVVAHWLQHTSRDGDMQLHVHSQIAHVARTAKDGKWRAPDSLGYNEHVGAITAQHLEEALSNRFGIEWTARKDGNGFEINGISGEMMRGPAAHASKTSCPTKTRSTIPRTSETPKLTIRPPPPSQPRQPIARQVLQIPEPKPETSRRRAQVHHQHDHFRSTE